MNEYEFTEQQLTDLGFNKVDEAEIETYYEYIFSPEDYFNSQCLLTNSVHSIDKVIKDMLSVETTFKVANPINEDGEEWLNEAQIKHYIAQGGF